jgi:thioredoxin 1
MMRIWLLLPLAFLSLSCGKDTANDRGAHAKIPTTNASDWEKDVLQNSGPVLVDFTATWCGPCQLMEPILASLSKDFQVRQVDFDANRQLANQLNVNAIPALFIFVNGKIARQHRGVTDEATLRRDLTELSQK